MPALLSGSSRTSNLVALRLPRLGIAAGVLVMAVLRSGLTAIGVPPFAHDVVTGGVLLAVALLDAEDLHRRLHGLRKT